MRKKGSEGKKVTIDSEKLKTIIYLENGTNMAELARKTTYSRDTIRRSLYEGKMSVGMVVELSGALGVRSSSFADVQGYYKKYGVPKQEKEGIWKFVHPFCSGDQETSRVTNLICRHLVEDLGLPPNIGNIQALDYRNFVRKDGSAKRIMTRSKMILLNIQHHLETNKSVSRGNSSL